MPTLDNSLHLSRHHNLVVKWPSEDLKGNNAEQF